MNKYPSILHYDSFKNVIKNIHKKEDPITLRGTIKLHGTHGDIRKNKDGLIFQSRNNILSENHDNMNFRKFMKEKNLDLLFEKVRKNNPEKNEIMISGEFCGDKIQKNVGLNLLNKRVFVIFDVMVDGVWLDLNLYKDICLEEEDIYNIYNYPSYTINTDLEKLKNGTTQNELLEITNKVEQECPFTKTFGFSGVGEGLVWKCLEYPDYKNWFKTKGLKHTTNTIKSLRYISEEEQKSLKNIDNFVDAVLTKSRLEQGLNYLVEMNNNSIKNYIEWVKNDVLKEDSDDIIKYGINKENLFKKINYVCATYYKKSFV